MKLSKFGFVLSIIYICVISWIFYSLENASSAGNGTALTSIIPYLVFLGQFPVLVLALLSMIPFLAKLVVEPSFITIGIYIFGCLQWYLIGAVIETIFRYQISRLKK